MDKYTVVSKYKAKEEGFIIDSVGYIYQLGNTNAILRRDRTNKVWLFITNTNSDENTWSFTESNLNKATKKAEAIYDMIKGYKEYQDLNNAKINVIEFLNSVLPTNTGA